RSVGSGRGSARSEIPCGERVLQNKLAWAQYLDVR
ncbi:hypothetical protein EMIHUDRAFT_364164, partial [Emiliania huxleyi CCMP1516]|uniref:Uncharacterized protein n=2 Tax=Emiliania huxleyi TaxID=2903 RepID=A0A0D3KB52_EMIH1